MFLEEKGQERHVVCGGTGQSNSCRLKREATSAACSVITFWGLIPVLCNRNKIQERGFHTPVFFIDDYRTTMSVSERLQTPRVRRKARGRKRQRGAAFLWRYRKNNSQENCSGWIKELRSVKCW